MLLIMFDQVLMKGRVQMDKITSNNMSESISNDYSRLCVVKLEWDHISFLVL